MGDVKMFLCLISNGKVSRETRGRWKSGGFGVFRGSFDDSGRRDETSFRRLI